MILSVWDQASGVRPLGSGLWGQASGVRPYHGEAQIIKGSKVSLPNGKA